MRKKTKHTMDVANVKDAWQKFFDENKKQKEDDLKKEGWKDLNEISQELNLSYSGTRDKLRRANVEKQMFTIYRGGKMRSVSFYRVK
jgi:hypothetical protein